MNNIKAFAVGTDGNMKRLAITYDKIDEETGKVINSNVKMNRIVADKEIMAAVQVVEEYAQSLVDAKESGE